MNKQNRLFLIFTIIIALAIVTSSFLFDIPYIWICGIVIIVAYYLYFTNSKNFLKTFLSITTKYSGDEKVEKAKILLSDKFRKSYKFKIFKEFSPSKIKQIEITNQNDLATTYCITTSDGQKYIFQIIKRNPAADGSNNFSWVIDDISGNEFEKSYDELNM